MRKFHLLTLLTLLAGLLLSACGASNDSETTPTPGLEQVQTAAIQTFDAAITQTALLKPTATLTPSPAVTMSPFPTIALGTPLPTSTSGATVNTCNKLLYIKDVTIPDSTQMTAGQSFTKTWQVQNSGTCAWAVGYKFSLVGGDAMGGQAITLTQAVSPGATYEISIPMTAPSNKTGTITGTWRMADAAGAYFGNPLTCVIVIGNASSVTATVTSIAYP